MLRAERSSRAAHGSSSRWRDSLVPVRMQRIALTAGLDDLRSTLVRTGEVGCVELECDAPSCTAPANPTSEDLVTRYADAATRHEEMAALIGWCPAADVPRLAARLVDVGGAVVPLPCPRGVDPPTLLRDASTAHSAFSPLVRSYGTVPYADLDPTFLAGLTYVLMFGLMFGDAGHGALLIACGLVLRSGRIKPLAGVKRLWPFVVGAGIAGTVCGLLYGEFFGPTGLVPALWLKPLDQPLPLLGYAIALGAALLAVAYGVGTVNRWREGGPGAALYAVSGGAGSALFLGAAISCTGVLVHSTPLESAGAAPATLGIVAAGIGLAAVAPRGPAGGFQVGIGLFDLVTRIGSNVVSFARLAAFGLTHAALGAVIWQGASGLAHRGPIGVGAAVLLFLVGNAAAFALEGLVVSVQAMRLEFYELFSRIFEPEGRPFRPFRLSASEVVP
ncbi:MAG TPA: V-type ATPase 116kDa subunit family protein [Actinocrinis sp.]|nr:V-type ATPase 116kDa subunit family protein [Actinocrinis sp.]